MSNEEYAALGQRGASYKALNNPTDLDPIILVPGMRSLRLFNASASNLSIKISSLTQEYPLYSGLGGSGIEGKLSGAKEPHWYCSGNADWFRLWIGTRTTLFPNLFSTCQISDAPCFFVPALGSMVGGYIVRYDHKKSYMLSLVVNSYFFAV
jgi:hypothetical protein